MKRQKKVKYPVDGFTWDDLAAKIDWEGGLAEAFLDHGMGEILDPLLAGLVGKFQESYRALDGYLRKNGGLL